MISSGFCRFPISIRSVHVSVFGGLGVMFLYQDSKDLGLKKAGFSIFLNIMFLHRWEDFS